MCQQVTCFLASWVHSKNSAPGWTGLRVLPVADVDDLGRDVAEVLTSVLLCAATVCVSGLWGRDESLEATGCICRHTGPTPAVVSAFKPPEPVRM